MAPSAGRARVFAMLTGGLGNQMFQYAACRALALRNGAELVLDTRSGFVRDRIYHSTYQLGLFPVKGRVMGLGESALTEMTRLYSRLLPGKRVNRAVGRFYDIVHEDGVGFQKSVFEHRVVRPTWMNGYWQSARYFEDCEREIREELFPPAPFGKRWIEMADRIRDGESVMLGVRLYEDCPNPAAREASGGVKSIADIEKAAKRLASRLSSPRFFVFCTHRASELRSLRLPGPIVFVTGDEGFGDAVSTLWLQTLCRNHIITNSSFFWWGAWLGQRPKSASQGRVLAASNFINPDSIVPGWESF